MADRARRADLAIAAEHHERGEPEGRGAIGVAEAVLDRMLRRQKRHHPIARHGRTEVGDEMPEVVFFSGADGAVRQADEVVVARHPAHGLIGVDPGVHAGGRAELGPWWTQLRGEDGQAGA